MVDRNTLIKYAALVGAAKDVGRVGKALSFIDNLPEEALGRLLGPPAKSVLKAPFGAADRLLRGGVVARGPLKGSRLRPVYGPGSIRPISAERYQQVIKGEAPGRVYKVNGIPVERKTTQGGLVGFAQRHPFIAGSAGLAAVSDNPIVQTLSPQGTLEYATSGFKPDIGPTREFQQIASTPALADNVFSRGPDPRFARNSKNQWRYNYAQQLPEQPVQPAEPAA